MKNNKPDEETRKSVREFFGINSFERDPIPCNTFNTLVKIYSLLPDQTNNPFAKYANSPQYTTLFTDGVRDNSETRRKKAVPYDSDHLSGVEVGNSSFHNERESDKTAAAFYDDGVLHRPEMITIELEVSKNSEMMGKTAHDEQGTTVETIGLCNVHEDLSSINRILMDDSDDPDMLKLLDKDVNVDLACDFGSILDIDRPCDKSLTMESFESERCIAGDITKKDAVHGKKRKGVEVNRSILEGEGISQASNSTDTVLSSCPEFVNQNVKCIKNALSKDKKLSEQIVLRELTETECLASTEWERENEGQVSSGQLNVGKRNQLIVSAKAKKTKVKNTKKKSDKDVKSEVGKLVRLEGEAYNNMKSGGGDPVVHGKIQKQVVCGLLRSPSTKADDERLPKACERLRYTREELLHLGKTAFVPEFIQKAAREIGAELHEKHQISAAFAIADSSILKNKRGGSASEARKEKKKLKRRKQRAELNRKLGVKRLKLKPIVKPKVVQHCRHYLNGRCLEGEKCKFSHDVVPLTKSKPCCHFARQACMKGDDCPFDHQLSKYPCNNYSDTGFCNRGESCSFSHKIAVKEGSEPSTVPLKSDTNTSVDQHDISKSKWQINASVPFTPGKAMVNSLKEASTTKAIQPAKKPKGLSFFSFGKSQLDNSVLPKDSEVSQQSSYTVEASVQPVMVEGASSEIRKSLDRTSVDRLGDNKLPLPPPHGDNNSRNISFGMKLMIDSAKEHLKDTSGSSDYAAGTSTQDRALDSSKIFKGTSTLERDLNLSEMLKGGPTQAKAKGIGVSSFGGPSYDITDRKSIGYKEKGNTNLSDKSKDVQPERPIWSSQTSSSQCPTKIDLPVKNPPSNSHRALQSALAFAAKYSSGFKTSSMAATKENTLNEETSSSGSKKSEPLQASKILQFLNSQ